MRESRSRSVYRPWKKIVEGIFLNSWLRFLKKGWEILGHFLGEIWWKFGGKLENWTKKENKKFQNFHFIKLQRKIKYKLIKFKFTRKKSKRVIKLKNREWDEFLILILVVVGGPGPDKSWRSKPGPTGGQPEPEYPLFCAHGPPPPPVRPWPNGPVQAWPWPPQAPPLPWPTSPWPDPDPWEDPWPTSPDPWPWRWRPVDVDVVVGKLRGVPRGSNRKIRETKPGLIA